MFGNTSGANGFEYKIGEVNIAEYWNPKNLDAKIMGGFNFSTEDKIIRWLVRGDTIYDVIIPEGSEVIDCLSELTPHSVFRANKIIIVNPKPVTDKMAMEEHKNVENTGEIAYELVKDDIEKTNIKQREVEVQMKKQELDTRQKLEEAYDTIDKQMKELREEFRNKTLKDENLLEYFKGDDPKDRISSIMVAGSILGGIQLRNIWRKNGKLLDGEKEEFPYNKEQILI